MTKYIPFLKAKSNEILALSELSGDILNKVKPFFDLPRESKNQSEDVILRKINTFNKSLSKFYDCKEPIEFYLDNYDLDEDILINGNEQYRYILGFFGEYNIIPVVGLDRNEEHNEAVFEYIHNHGGKVAFRLSYEDIDSYTITKLSISPIWRKLKNLSVNEIHLLIDLRYILPTDVSKLTHKVASFLKSITKDYPFEMISVTGSTIPANIAEILTTYESKVITRSEWKIWSNLIKDKDTPLMVYGDYGIVSPDYSDLDIDPKLMRKVSTPKVFYTFEGNYLGVRGGSFQNDPDGNGQYFKIATTIAEQRFFRNITDSYGEKYTHQRSDFSIKKPAKAGSPGSWIKAMLTSHITYIVRSLP